jgi:protein-S-isoprenylcysteine O-methyltransferase Ste14
MIVKLIIDVIMAWIGVIGVLFMLYGIACGIDAWRTKRRAPRMVCVRRPAVECVTKDEVDAALMEMERKSR